MIAFESFGHKSPSYFEEKLKLKPGPLRLELEYTNINGTGVLQLEIVKKNESFSLKWKE